MIRSRHAGVAMPACSLLSGSRPRDVPPSHRPQALSSKAFSPTPCLVLHLQKEGTSKSTYAANKASLQKTVYTAVTFTAVKV